MLLLLLSLNECQSDAAAAAAAAVVNVELLRLSMNSAAVKVRSRRSSQYDVTTKTTIRVGVTHDSCHRVVGTYVSCSAACRG